jgi:lipoate-protein ligase A
VDECRVIVDSAAPGAWNMAVDEALLLEAAAGGLATLRFYAWSEPTLSIGYFQRVADRARHAPSRECAVVRRQTGGGAILHDREITYSLVLPASHPLARQPTALYAAVHDAIIAVLAPHSDFDRGQKLLRLEKPQNSRHGDEPFLCFQRRAPGDVLLLESQDPVQYSEPPWDKSECRAGTKILGSAQRRLRGALLQHGSLLLETSPFAPELAGWRNLTGARVPLMDLINSLDERLRYVVSGRQIRCSAAPDVQLKASELANNKYSTADWTNRRQAVAQSRPK